jgi:hypothetical protein
VLNRTTGRGSHIETQEPDQPGWPEPSWTGVRGPARAGRAAATRPPCGRLASLIAAGPTRKQRRAATSAVRVVAKATRPANGCASVASPARWAPPDPGCHSRWREQTEARPARRAGRLAVAPSRTSRALWARRPTPGRPEGGPGWIRRWAPPAAPSPEHPPRRDRGSASPGRRGTGRARAGRPRGRLRPRARPPP